MLNCTFVSFNFQKQTIFASTFQISIFGPQLYPLLQSGAPINFDQVNADVESQNHRFV